MVTLKPCAMPRNWKWPTTVQCRGALEHVLGTMGYNGYPIPQTGRYQRTPRGCLSLTLCVKRPAI